MKQKYTLQIQETPKYFMLICELYKFCYFYGSLINASHQHRELSKSSFHQLKIYTFPIKISKFK